MFLPNLTQFTRLICAALIKIAQKNPIWEAPKCYFYVKFVHLASH
jgi:hypothetical protein